MRIYLTRHGETKWNLEGRCQGWKNSDLTEKGAADAKRLGARLKLVDFDCVYSSPLGRAVETAECIVGDKGTSIVLKDELREINFGVWEGMTFSEIEKMYPEQFKNIWNQPHLYEPVGGERIPDLIERVKELLNELISDSTKENIMIVTHAFVMKAIVSIIKGYSLEEFWNPPFTGNTCLTVLEVTEKGISMTMEADLSHLNE